MGDMYLVLEEPPKSAYEDEQTGNRVKTNWQWTNESDKHGDRVPCSKLTVPATTCTLVRYMDVNSVLLHEFGHTLGLHDFYGDDTMDHLNAVMNRSHTIEDEDKTQLRAIYRDHGRH